MRRVLVGTATAPALCTAEYATMNRSASSARRYSETRSPLATPIAPRARARRLDSASHWANDIWPPSTTM